MKERQGSLSFLVTSPLPFSHAFTIVSERGGTPLPLLSLFYEVATATATATASAAAAAAATGGGGR